MRSTLLALCLALGFAACQEPSYYEWGHYSDSVWTTTFGEGEIDIGGEIDSLNETVERARTTGKPIPPGMHAHLGMLYSLRGELDTAVAAFESEKELYPESARFMDLLIDRIQGRAGGLK